MLCSHAQALSAPDHLHVVCALALSCLPAPASEGVACWQLFTEDDWLVQPSRIQHSGRAIVEFLDHNQGIQGAYGEVRAQLWPPKWS